MSTSDGAPIGPEGSVAVAQLTKEVERLANELFSAPPGGGVSPGALVAPPTNEFPIATATGGGVVPPVVSEDQQQPPTHASPMMGGGAAPVSLVESAGASPSAGFARPSPSALTPVGQPEAHRLAEGSATTTPNNNPFSVTPSFGETAFPLEASLFSPTMETQPTANPFGSAPSFGDASFAHEPAPINDPLPAPTDAPHRSKGGERPAVIITPELVPQTDARSHGLFDPHAIKKDFPILHQNVNGRPLVWLDNAATTQKPNAVIDRLSHYYRHENSNVHRAAHTLAARATDAYEGARNQVKRFLNASSPEEIVFVRGATEGINLVAQSWGRKYVEPGDEIVITWLEHHANIVPWQMLCCEKGAKLKVVPVDDTGQVILEEFERLLSSRTRIVALPQVSNALGTVVPAQEMVAMAHRRGATVLVDGAQAVSHMPVDVQALDADFYVFSGHKIFAPTGIGVVYGKRDILANMPPWQGGGNMIADVTFAKTVYQGPPARFEAGTGSIADAVGLGAALEYLSGIGLPKVERYEHELRVYAEQCLRQIPGLTLIGTAKNKAGVISFVLDGIRTEDVGGLLDLEGIAVRSGHHCAQPILRRFGLESTVRASLAPYNTREDIDALVTAVKRLQVGRSRT